MWKESFATNIAVVSVAKLTSGLYSYAGFWFVNIEISYEFEYLTSLCLINQSVVKQTYNFHSLRGSFSNRKRSMI